MPESYFLSVILPRWVRIVKNSGSGCAGLAGSSPENIRGALLYDEVPDLSTQNMIQNIRQRLSTAGRRPETIDHFAATVFNI